MKTGRFGVFHGDTEIAFFNTLKEAKSVIPWKYQPKEHEAFSKWEERPFGITIDHYTIVDFAGEERRATYFWLTPFTMQGIQVLSLQKITYQVSHNEEPAQTVQNMHEAQAMIPSDYLTHNDWIHFQGPGRRKRMLAPFEDYMEHYTLTVTFHDAALPGKSIDIKIQFFAPAEIKKPHVAVGVDFGGVVVSSTYLDSFRYNKASFLEVPIEEEVIQGLKTLQKVTKGKLHILCDIEVGPAERIKSWWVYHELSEKTGISLEQFQFVEGVIYKEHACYELGITTLLDDQASHLEGCAETIVRGFLYDNSPDSSTTFPKVSFGGFVHAVMEMVIQSGMG